MPAESKLSPDQPDRSAKLSEFAPAFAWLLAKGVSSERIACLFHTSSVNVRVIAHRWRTSDDFLATPRPALHKQVMPAEKEGLGIRPGHDEVVITRAKDAALDSLHAQVDALVFQHRADYGFPTGARKLRRLIPLVGYPADVRRIHLAALIHHHIAWFLVHTGACRSAMTEAATAMNLWRAAYQESPQPLYADEFIGAALIESHAALLMRQPQAAFVILEVAASAAPHGSALIGSDHYRQRGIACFQMREDEQARQNFEMAGQVMERLGEAEKPASVVLTSSRHINLLGAPNWDRAQEGLSVAEVAFGPDSLEYSMSLHWAVACAICTGSQRVKVRAQEMLNNRRPPADHFAHQTTIARLLSLTPDLGLDDRLQKAWVRRALYENARRNF